MNPNPQKSIQRLYLAAPLFSEAERNFNLHVADQLRDKFRVFVPQRDGRLLVELLDEGCTPLEASQRVFNADVKAIEECDVLVAVLDGRSVDEGVAFEIGFAFSLRKTCVGLQTDFRRLLPSGNNPMIQCALKAILSSVEDLSVWLDGKAAPGLNEVR